MNRPWLSFTIIALLFSTSASIATAQVYKWTDASGQIHYGQKKPDDATSVQTLNIAPPPPAPAATDSAAEIARINALSDQMARERQATEQARQEQAIRNLEEANQQLKNDLLNQQLQQQKEKEKDDSNIILGYPPSYPYPQPYPPYPPNPYPPHPWPCEPWPACSQPTAPEPPHPGSSINPIPTFQPKPVGVTPAPGSFFRGR